jgi:hypothetical protein
MKVICTIMGGMLYETGYPPRTNHGWLTEESYSEPARHLRWQIDDSTRAVLDRDFSLGLPLITHYRNAFETSDRLSYRLRGLF